MSPELLQLQFCDLTSALSLMEPGQLIPTIQNQGSEIITIILALYVIKALFGFFFSVLKALENSKRGEEPAQGNNRLKIQWRADFFHLFLS